MAVATLGTCFAAGLAKVSQVEEWEARWRSAHETMVAMRQKLLPRALRMWMWAWWEVWEVREVWDL